MLIKIQTAKNSPKGSYRIISGLQVYQSTPTDFKLSLKKGHLLFLPDGFGLATHNLQLADMYAACGKLNESCMI